ncbi:hypothetical protein ONV78_28935 [Hahella sp. CR1]|uniref:hypothetical protein n=1 Tax=Hahella sp. CR1 TaxID=2992807 RepID=UPI002442233A|nr:hypothetical protein [Hahella sp. CR1]MDG9671796.1 hypothetical protein [Hahella sp. CR1]
MNLSQILMDLKFWSVVISFLALALSQLSPIHVLIRRAKLEFDVRSKILLANKIGNPNLKLYLIIRNAGGRIIRIKKIVSKIYRDSKLEMELPAQTYLSKSSDGQQILLTPFSLKLDKSGAPSYIS